MKPGSVVHGYRVDGLVATGSMGAVYRVTHLERGTLHALKILPIASRRQRLRLLREADLLVRLSHPNIVTLTELLDVDGDPALVLEWVDGPTLAAWQAGVRLSPQEAEAVFQQIAAGIAHAHRRGIVHRDLKPTNVILADSAAGLVPKVADFGVARVFLDDPFDPHLTETGASIGSPAYMAPEQIADPRTVDQRADVFALGCLLYELVSGRRAFPQPDPLDVMNAIASGDRVPIADLVPDLPHRFVTAIEGALRTDRDERFPDVDALLDALAEGGGATPVAADRSAPASPRRVGSGIAFLLLAAIALAAGAALGWLTLG